MQIPRWPRLSKRSPDVVGDVVGGEAAEHPNRLTQTVAKRPNRLTRELVAGMNQVLHPMLPRFLMMILLRLLALQLGRVQTLSWLQCGMPRIDCRLLLHDST